MCNVSHFDLEKCLGQFAVSRVRDEYVLHIRANRNKSVVVFMTQGQYQAFAAAVNDFNTVLETGADVCKSDVYGDDDRPSKPTVAIPY